MDILYVISIWNNFEREVWIWRKWRDFHAHKCTRSSQVGFTSNFWINTKRQRRGHIERIISRIGESDNRAGRLNVVKEFTPVVLMGGPQIVSKSRSISTSRRATCATLSSRRTTVLTGQRSAIFSKGFITRCRMASEVYTAYEGGTVHVHHLCVVQSTSLGNNSMFCFSWTLPLLPQRQKWTVQQRFDMLINGTIVSRRKHQHHFGELLWE